MFCLTAEQQKKVQRLACHAVQSGDPQRRFSFSQSTITTSGALHEFKNFWLLIKESLTNSSWRIHSFSCHPSFSWLDQNSKC